jgi:hypothetical protein
MQLVALLDQARAASPGERIEWRDRIAPYGQRAIDGVKPWLADSALAAFAIRVIWRVGEEDSPEEAIRVLRAARGKLPPALKGDADWAIKALKAPSHAAPAAATTVPAAPRRVETPRFSQVARRRSR